MKVAVIGLGKLGLPLAAVLCEAGHDVFGFDANLDLRKKLKNREFANKEPQVEDLLQKNSAQLQIVDSVEEAVKSSHLSFVIVPTPSEKSGAFSNSYVEQVLVSAANAIREMDSFHVIDIVSTVMPNSCDEVFIPLLEKTANKKIGVDFGLCYNPEFIALGSVVHNMKQPDMHLIGASDSKSGKTVEHALKSITSQNVPSQIMNLKEAELVKIAVNNFVTMKLSFANSLMQASVKLKGVDIDVVTNAIGMDSRIGHKYLKGGSAFGGPCFPRDTRALSSMLKNIDVSSALSDATDEVNQLQNEFVSREVLRLVGDNAEVGIIGFSYKPNTHIYEESPGLHLSRILTTRGVKLKVWEPLINGLVEELEGVDFLKSSSELSTIKKAVITRQLTTEEINDLLKNLSDCILIDPWRQLDSSKVEEAGSLMKYFPLGRG